MKATWPSGKSSRVGLRRLCSSLMAWAWFLCFNDLEYFCVSLYSIWFSKSMIPTWISQAEWAGLYVLFGPHGVFFFFFLTLWLWNYHSKIERCHTQVLISRVALNCIMSEKPWPRVVHVSVTLHRMVVETLVRIEHWEASSGFTPHARFFHIVLNPWLAHWENKRLSMTYVF